MQYIKEKKGKSKAIGFKMLFIQLLISSVGWGLLDIVPTTFKVIVALMITVISIYLWNNAMKKVLSNGFVDILIVSLYFTVPSVMFSIMYYQSYLHGFQMNSVVYDFAWTIINYPFLIGNIVLEIQSALAITIWVQILLPIIAMNILVLMNYIEYKLQARKTLISGKNQSPSN